MTTDTQQVTPSLERLLAGYRDAGPLPLDQEIQIQQLKALRSIKSSLSFIVLVLVVGIALSFFSALL